MRLSYGHFTEFFPVLLISDENYDHFRLTLLRYLRVPVFKIQKSVQTGYVISKHHAVSSPIENLSDRFERLLTCSVPNLEFEVLLVQTDHQSSKLYSNCDFVVLYEIVCCDAMHQATFANS